MYVHVHVYLYYKGIKELYMYVVYIHAYVILSIGYDIGHGTFI
jgi:hypothetical protein